MSRHQTGTHGTRSGASYLNIVDMIPIPCRAKEFVTESKDENILHHLLSEIVVDSENLIFIPVWLQCFLQLTRAAKVLAEWFLDLYAHSIQSA